MKEIRGLFPDPKVDTQCKGYCCTEILIRTSPKGELKSIISSLCGFLFFLFDFSQSLVFSMKLPLLESWHYLCPASELNLKATLTSGQSFRWNCRKDLLSKAKVPVDLFPQKEEADAPAFRSIVDQSPLKDLWVGVIKSHAVALLDSQDAILFRRLNQQRSQNEDNGLLILSPLLFHRFHPQKAKR